MAEISGFHNSVNGDRRVKSDFFARFFGSLIGNGVFPNPSTSLQVIANGDMTVTVKAGKGWVNGVFYENTADKIVNLDVADGVLKRIDRIVVSDIILERNTYIKVKKGSFASSPAAPALQRDADAHDLGLADIYIVNGAVSISQANITDLRLNSAYCGIVHGLVDQVDTTTIFNQYQAWFGEFSGGAEADFNEFVEQLNGILSGDMAGNLLLKINENTDDIAKKLNCDDYVKSPGYATATGSANIYAVTLDPVPTAYTDGMGVVVKINVQNTGASAININGLGAKSILDSKGNAMTSGKLKANTPYTMRYNGVNFILQGEGASGNAIASDLYSGKTASVDAGDIVGTNPYKAGVVLRGVKDMNFTEVGGKINVKADYPYMMGVVVGNDGKVYALYNDNGTQQLRIYDTSLNFISMTTLSTYKGMQRRYTFLIDSSNNLYFGTDYGTFVKLNTATKNYDFTLNYNDMTYKPYEAKINSNNEIFIGIYGNLANKNVVKLNTSGGEIWAKSAIISGGQTLDIDQYNNVYYGGYGNPGNSTSITLVSYNTNGTLRWSRTIIQTNGYGIGKVMYCRDTNVLYGVVDQAIYKFNPATGELISTLSFQGYSAFFNDEDGFIYAIKSTSPYGYDVYDGNLNLVYVSEGFYQNQCFGFHVKDDYAYSTRWYSSMASSIFKCNKYNKYTLK